MYLYLLQLIYLTVAEEIPVVVLPLAPLDSKSAVLKISAFAVALSVLVPSEQMINLCDGSSYTNPLMSKLVLAEPEPGQVI